MPSRIRITNIESVGSLNVRIVRQGGQGEPEALRSEFELDAGAAQVVTVYSDSVVVITPHVRDRNARS